MNEDDVESWNRVPLIKKLAIVVLFSIKIILIKFFKKKLVCFTFMSNNKRRKFKSDYEDESV